MKSIVLALAMLTSGLVAGCATSGSYCDIARAVRPSVEDTLTAETKRQILAENTKLEMLCGVRP